MSKRKSLLLLATAVSLFSFWYFKSDPAPRIPAVAADSANSPIEPPATQTEPSVTPSPASTENSAPIAPGPSRTVTEIAPDNEALHHEVARNPHEPPPSLLAFAGDLGERLDEVIAAPEKAGIFFKELSDCVLGIQNQGSSPIAPAVQAVCLANARRLSEKLPQLKTDYDHLLERAPPSVAKLVH